MSSIINFKSFWLPFVTSLIVMLISCNDEGKNAFKVSGYVYYQGQPISGATISIDEKLNLTTETNTKGYFELTGVSSGDHRLKVSREFGLVGGRISESQNGENPFSEGTFDIAVFEDLFLNSLKLPKAVKLSSLYTMSPSSNSLQWSSSDSKDFREYKVYQHSTSGLDETTGKLIHVSTSKTDTTFVDSNLKPSTDYYYRVYVMNDFGRLGGSNILKLRTSDIIIVNNGGFETLNEFNLPLNWSFYSPSKLSSDNKIFTEGTKSLKFSPGDLGAANCINIGIYQKIPVETLTPNAKYKLIFKYRSSFTKNDSGLMFSFANLNQGILMSFQNNAEWKDFYYEFNLPNDVGANVFLTLQFCLPNVTGDYWIDDVKILKL